MGHDTRRLWLAVCQFGTSMALVLASVLIAASAHGQTATIGRTWPIAEPDALAEIQARAARQPANIAERFGPRESWSAMQSAALGIAQADRGRTVVPFHTLDFDIRLPGGKLLYPKGYTFNPLAYVSLSQRLVVVHPRDLDWALARARPTDWILLAGGEEAASDPVALGEKVRRPLFVLEERIKDRLGLTAAPVIIEQVGQKLELREFAIERPRQ